MPLDRNKFFENAFGIYDRNYASTKNFLMEVLAKNQSQFILSDKRSLDVGSFSTPTLSESRDELQTLTSGHNFSNKKVSGRNIIGDIEKLHESSKGVFMVASQFNTLEHADPTLGPNDGTSNYSNDFTQGPICAMSAVAGLAFRNFCVPIKNGIVSTDADAYAGQTNENQINCFVSVQELIIKKAKELGIKSPDRIANSGIISQEIPVGDFFAFQNGYIESTKGNLEKLNSLLQQGGDEFKQQLKDAFRVGIHRDTEVTSSDNKKLVTQVYASAIGINYSNLGDDVTEEERKKLWEPLAKIVLEGAYEHTILEGLKNNAKKMLAGQPTEPILLTQLGGGAFKNDPEWIKEAIASAIKKAGSYGVPFDVQLVHYKTIDPVYQDGFLERVVAKANGAMASPAMASPAPALTSRFEDLPTISEFNTNFLQQRGGEVNHIIDKASNNYFLSFNSREDAENKSQELANLGIVGRGGNKKFVNESDGGNYYIILTDENVDKLRKIEANLNFLKQNLHSDSEFGIDTQKNDNYNLIFKTREEATVKSEYLASLGVVGGSGNKFVQQRMSSDGKNTEYFLTLTNDNIVNLSSKSLIPDSSQRTSFIRGNRGSQNFIINFAPAPAVVEVSPPARVLAVTEVSPPAPAQVTYQKNLEFLQGLYQRKYEHECIVNHEFDERGQNNYTLLFPNLTPSSKDTILPRALRESQSLANIGIVGSQGNKRVILNTQGPFIILTDENVNVLREKQSSFDAVRVDVDPSYGPARGAVRVVPITPVPAPAPAPVPAPALMEPMEPFAMAKDPIVEENIRLLTENIQPSINNVKVEHEKKVAENQYRLIFKNAEDTTRAYGLLLKKYSIKPEAKEKEKEGEFVIVLNDRNVEQFKSSIQKQQSPSVFGDTAIASVSGGLSNLARALPTASNFGGGTGNRPAGAFDVDASLSFGGGAGASSFAEFEASRARLAPGAGSGGVATASISFDGPGAGVGSRGAGYRPAGASDVPDAGASASISFGESRVEGSRPQNSGLIARWSEPPHIVYAPDTRSPSPEVRTSDCFSCIRALFKINTRE